VGEDAVVMLMSIVTVKDVVPAASSIATVTALPRLSQPVVHRETTHSRTHSWTTVKRLTAQQLV
jgi:hypothetical protein